MVYLIKEVKYSEIDKLLKLGFAFGSDYKFDYIPERLLVDLSNELIKFTNNSAKHKELDWKLVEDKHFSLKESTFKDRADYARTYLNGYAAEKGFWKIFYSTHSSQTFHAVKGKLKYDTL